MKIISHRGNVSGPIANRENRPSYIDCAIQLGYDVEIDVRYIDGNLWLGHDMPDFKIEESWIIPRMEKLWFHCKNLSAVENLRKISPNIKTFCHSSDPFVLVSSGNVWVHDLSLPLYPHCIIPLLSSYDIKSFIAEHRLDDVGAICTDYVFQVKRFYDDSQKLYYPR